MNPNRDDMDRIGEELEKELQNLHLPDGVKQKLSQKMKKPYRQHRGAWMALPAAAVFAVLLVYGWLGQSVRDQTDAPVPMSSVPIDHVVARVNVRNLDAILYSARADENGGIWLEYAVNTVADEKVVVRLAGGGSPYRLRRSEGSGNGGGFLYRSSIACGIADMAGASGGCDHADHGK